MKLIHNFILIILTTLIVVLLTEITLRVIDPLDKQDKAKIYMKINYPNDYNYKNLEQITETLKKLDCILSKSRNLLGFVFHRLEKRKNLQRSIKSLVSAYTSYSSDSTVKKTKTTRWEQGQVLKTSVRRLHSTDLLKNR